MTRALLGRTLGPSLPSTSAGAASAPLGQQDPADLTALDGHPQLVGRLDQRIQRPHTGLLGVDRSQGPVGLPDQPTGRVLADQGDQLATLGLVEPAWPTGPGSVTKPVDTMVVEAVQPLPHGLGVTAQPGGDLAGSLAVPASDHDAGAQDPVGGCVAAGREPAQGALLVGISRWSGVQQRRHGQRAPYGRIPGWTGTGGAFNHLPNLRNEALGTRPCGGVTPKVGNRGWDLRAAAGLRQDTTVAAGWIRRPGGGVVREVHPAASARGTA